MLIEFLQKNRLSRTVIHDLRSHLCIGAIKQIEQYLNKKDEILDLGSGTCDICEILASKGYNVTALDIKNLSFVETITPIIYDGIKIPFMNNKFETTLIFSVLHHTSNPKKILLEAKRVSKKIIIMEDIYSNKIQKYSTYFFDSLFNLQLIGHPHSNKNDKEWKLLFKKTGLKLRDVKYRRSLLVFTSIIYSLEK